MPEIKLEYRIAKSHIGKGMIESPDITIPTHDPYGSYARHLPDDWDLSKIDKRTQVVSRLSQNLENTVEGQEMDLNPLKDDQRVSGFIYGTNPMQSMFDLISEYAKRYPEQPFFGKWGGNQPQKTGRFVFYVEDEKDAYITLQKIKEIATDMNIPLDVRHQYGLTTYQDFVTIDERFRSKIKDRERFKQVLKELKGFPHFFHELF